jgi:hypothetical protein
MRTTTRAFIAATALFVSSHAAAELAFDPTGGYGGQITCDEFDGVNHHSVIKEAKVCIVAILEGNFMRAYMTELEHNPGYALWHIGYWIPDSKEPAKKGQLRPDGGTVTSK